MEITQTEQKKFDAIEDLRKIKAALKSIFDSNPKINNPDLIAIKQNLEACNSFSELYSQLSVAAARIEGDDKETAGTAAANSLDSIKETLKQYKESFIHFLQQADIEAATKSEYENTLESVRQQLTMIISQYKASDKIDVVMAGLKEAVDKKIDLPRLIAFLDQQNSIAQKERLTKNPNTLSQLSGLVKSLSAAKIARGWKADASQAELVLHSNASIRTEAQSIDLARKKAEQNANEQQQKVKELQEEIKRSKQIDSNLVTPVVTPTHNFYSRIEFKSGEKGYDRKKLEDWCLKSRFEAVDSLVQLIASEKNRLKQSTVTGAVVEDRQGIVTTIQNTEAFIFNILSDVKNSKPANKKDKDYLLAIYQLYKNSNKCVEPYITPNEEYAGKIKEKIDALNQQQISASAEKK